MDTQYRQVAEVEVAPMLEETILYHSAKQRFCVLNATAAFVWSRLEAPSSASELASAVAAEFAGVAPSDAQRDVAAMLSELRKLELIEPSANEEQHA